jgi:hypothetical protein
MPFASRPATAADYALLTPEEFAAQMLPNVLVLEDGDAHDGVGYAAFRFDTAFPGVYPVQVARVGYARPLFDALAPAARQDRVIVTVEGDRGLYEALMSAGARLNHAVFRMGARLAPAR